MQVVDGYEFVVTPDQTWILTENGPNVVRIYTDGREHLEDDLIWPTYTGDSVGHWEDDTLVFHDYRTARRKRNDHRSHWSDHKRSGTRDHAHAQAR